MTKILQALAPYRKTVLALVGAGVVILGRTFGVDSAAYVDVTLVLTALGVYAAPNAGP